MGWQPEVLLACMERVVGQIRRRFELYQRYTLHIAYGALYTPSLEVSHYALGWGSD